MILFGGLILTFAAYQWAVIHRRPGDWLPGISQAVLGATITAVLSFATGLTALLRRERRAWIALPPLLAGLATILYFTSNILGKR